MDKHTSHRILEIVASTEAQLKYAEESVRKALNNRNHAEIHVSLARRDHFKSEIAAYKRLLNLLNT